MKRTRRLALFVLALAVSGAFLGVGIESLKAFSAPVFVPSFFKKIESKIEAKIEVLENSIYLDESEDKLASGLANVMAGWVDLIAEPERSLENGESVWRGIGKGIRDAIVNTTGGLLRLITFPLPALNIPLPEDGVEL